MGNVKTDSLLRSLKRDVIPVGLQPGLIGKVVGLQVFKFTDDKQTISTESLNKFVGILEAYAIKPAHELTFVKLAGFDQICVEHERQHMEVYLYAH